MKNHAISLLLSIAAMSSTNCLAAPQEDVTITLLETTDVHGNLFPFNYITGREWPGSLARVATYVDSIRADRGAENIILLDNGDLLQGQPTVYYYNFIDAVSPHAATEALKFMGYDAMTLGNHDIETGHDVYDRYVAMSGAPVLGANIVVNATGEPYVKPYTIIRRQGRKIAILGMITPAIPTWLPENLWEGIHFDDMISTASRWVKIIEEREQPDAIIGLFHSGGHADVLSQGYLENASIEVGRRVPGFDAIFMGHDHRVWDLTVTDPKGDSVVVVNPANNAVNIGRVDITFTLGPDGQVASKSVKGSVEPVGDLIPSASFMNRFAAEMDTVASFVGRQIGQATGPFLSRDAYFGPSSFMDLIHRLQLEIGDAEVSMAAPLSFDATIEAGPVTMADMFSLYKYENLLYTMALTGREIKDYLEESYDIWTNQISSPDDHLIRFASDNPSPSDNRLKYPSYNFDSAAGINYTVDVTKPRGERVTIISLADGSPFDLDRSYRVAINSYRGNGGGNLLTKGAGIPHDQLSKRIIKSTDKDLRYYLMKAIEEKGIISPTITPNWRFIPEEIAEPAARRDSLILFSGPTDIQK
ncbi:MAG: 5'-nucleotidase C-terminal domain-containing protein [Pseudoflavonifractor sp.]|nr:5'-nucleotidase C-terminal domain-containing protein [Alloprevotella sp.]MCM1116841.1 5'-nucleotidase C-terminal domain-containing protein [Pseudoflavonifractor sp.]